MQTLRQCICCASLQIRLKAPIQFLQKWAMPQCYLHVSNYHSAKNKLNSPSYNLFDTRHSKPWCLSQSWLTRPTGCMEQRRFKGHSKWQNIKHIKGLKDDIKQKIINKTMARLRMAIKGKTMFSHCVSEQNNVQSIYLCYDFIQVTMLHLFLSMNLPCTGR